MRAQTDPNMPRSRVVLGACCLADLLNRHEHAIYDVYVLTGEIDYVGLQEREINASQSI